jgi:hypothetical protein
MVQIISSLIDQLRVDAIAQDRLMMYHDTYDGSQKRNERLLIMRCKLQIW